MKINSISASAILDSRKDKTIQVAIKTNAGTFSASAPQGKSTGKFEVRCYKKSIDEDIKSLKNLSDYFSEDDFVEFDDLKKVEEVLDRHVGGNTLLALECAVLKAVAKESKKEVWELINEKAKKLPAQIGNVIGGGKHSELTNNRMPDFQEFLVISKDYELIKKVHKEAEKLLKGFDENFSSKRNDENAWQTSLNEKEVLDILLRLKKEFKIDIGLDIAASSFYKRKKYKYENPKLDRDIDEQLGYVSNLIKNYSLLYIEDAFEENDFESFAKLLKKCPDSLIVGDDLTVTNSKRLEKAIKIKSINAIIVKPNQCGSLLEVKRVVELARKNNIKIIFSHRSGETEENILADLAFGFQADYIKVGVVGKERERKIERLIQISESLN